MLGSPSLLVKFAALSLVLMSVLGVTLSFQLARIIRQRSLATNERMAGQLVAFVANLATVGVRTNSNGLPTVQQALLLRHSFDAYSEQGLASGVDAWTPNGTLSYSDDPVSIGSKLPMPAAARASLAGARTSRVITSSTDMHLQAIIRRDGPVFAIYVPVRLGVNAPILAAVAMYMPYRPIAEAISSDTRTASLLLAVCFGLLYLGLFHLVWRASHRLRRTADLNEQLASHDALTGLPNRVLLADRFGQALRADARAGTTTGLLLIDLDRFKEVNDTFGHHYGDELLSQVGPRLAAVLRDVDTVARLGGDEFAVLLPDARSVEDAVAVAAKLRAALETPFHVHGIDLDVEASIGVVLAGEHGKDPTTLLQRVDIAMYVAKTQNLGVFAYDPDIDRHSPAKLALLGDLRRALERGELILHYQPKISISTGHVISAEALVRWQHPDRGLIFPDDFIPLAEHTGLIGPLTRCVLDTALAQVRSWTDADRPLGVSVNLSARNLLDERLPAQVAELLATHGVPAELLELEVTESALMTEPVRAQRLLEELSALGVRISVDDFGVGYTSLGQLKTLPVSELKIDKSFVMTMTDDRSNALIVHSVVDLGHNLGLTIVAEGVETEQALSALREFGCDVAQGYHVSRPMTADALDTWLHARTILPVQSADTATPHPPPPRPRLPANPSHPAVTPARSQPDAPNWSG